MIPRITRYSRPPASCIDYYFNILVIGVQVILYCLILNRNTSIKYFPCAINLVTKYLVFRKMIKMCVYLHTLREPSRLLVTHNDVFPQIPVIAVIKKLIRSNLMF